MISDKLKNLGVRTLSALVAVVILVGVYWLFEMAGMVILSLGLELLVIREGLRLFDWNPLQRKFQILLGVGIYCLFLSILFIEPYRFQIMMMAMILGIAISLQLRVGDSLDTLQSIQSKALLALMYLALFPALLVDLLFKYQGDFWFMSLLVMVFSGDVGAYLTGVTMGKHHLLPAISPKKTWEGAAGGFVATVFSAYLLHQFADLRIPMVGWLAMAGLISLVAQSGDFFESLLKRIAHVKDSGAIMPGHGGILDRIDGLLFAAPIMSCALSLFDPWI